MTTFSIKAKDIKHDWYEIDATGKNLGRLSTCVARILRGKNKPCFTPHMDTGDFVVITNAEKIAVTGNKLNDKMYYHHTGFQGGLKSITLKDLLKKDPEKVIYFAVRGMLPKGALGTKIISKLKIYAGAEHPHVAQNPKKIDIEV